MSVSLPPEIAERLARQKSLSEAESAERERRKKADAAENEFHEMCNRAGRFFSHGGRPLYSESERLLRAMAKASPEMGRQHSYESNISDLRTVAAEAAKLGNQDHADNLSNTADILAFALDQSSDGVIAAMLESAAENRRYDHVTGLLESCCERIRLNIDPVERRASKEKAEAAAQQALRKSQASTTTGPTPGEELNIELDGELWTAARDGQVAEFNGKKIAWKLFARLCTVPIAIVSKADLSDAGWPATPADDAFYRQIDIVKKLILRIGLTVKNHPRRGYQVEVVPVARKESGKRKKRIRRSYK